MSPSVALVASTTATEPPDLLAGRLRGLLDAGWDARLLCKGERWADRPAFRDPALARRIELASGRGRHLPPRALLRRPGALVRYLAANGETGPFDQRLLELRPDLVHFHSGHAGWKGMRLKTLLGCRVVVSFREDGRDLEVRDPALLWQGADLLLFPDDASLEHALERGCPHELAVVLPRPPSVVEGRAERPSRAGFLRVVSAGPVTWQLGLEHAVHAMRHLLDMGVGCEYRIVGDGAHLLPVAFARHQLGLTEHVEFVSPDGPVQLSQELARADVFLDPAVTDTTSSAALVSAQALGIPCVVTEREGLPAEAGLVVRRRDARAIADALARLAADLTARERVGAAGRRDGEPELGIEHDVARLGHLYRRALA